MDHFSQLGSNLSDAKGEEPMNDSSSMRGFVRIDPDVEATTDHTTLRNFQSQFLENRLGQKCLTAEIEYLRQYGMNLMNRTVTDVTFISTPNSTKSEGDKRDHEVHQLLKKHSAFRKKMHLGMENLSITPMF
jgi:IS5 family transposase